MARRRDLAAVEYLRSISPFTNAQSIRTPLLVVHGENDPRVNVGEAERIVAAVRGNGVPVWYVRFGGEGTGSRRGTTPSISSTPRSSS